MMSSLVYETHIEWTFQTGCYYLLPAIHLELIPGFDRIKYLNK